MRTFTEKVKDIVRRIPKGKVLTYKQVAKKSGNSKAFRAVGMIMSKNFDPSVPCHRVINSSGKIGNYNRGGMKVKRKILTEEGYIFEK